MAEMSGLENPMKELEWPGGSKQRSRCLGADEINALVALESVVAGIPPDQRGPAAREIAECLGAALE